MKKLSTQELISKMILARVSHIKWGEYQKQCKAEGLPEMPHIGSEEDHNEWINIYDQVIEKLNTIK